MNTQQIALITYTDKGNYSGISDEENSKLLDLLKEKGLNVSFQIWDDPAVDWSRFDLIVLKSPWDYFDKIDAFYIWLGELEKLDVRVLNPVDIVRWNANKRYLLDLQEQGVKVVPTVWLEKGDTFDAAALFKTFSAEKVIVKPAISGGAKNTFALTLTEAEEKTEIINQLLQQESFLAQPFLEEIKTKGEWSFLFFNGQYSHTVLKTVKPGDFRVQHFYGGTVHTPEPPVALLVAAQHIVDKHAPGCLYARVDGVELNGALALMELELIEPFLFMAMSEGALQRYCEALLMQLQETANLIP
ncbi:RimK family alpha-L-glutamate ligase [Pontibacter toksunensis]|uniref:RimK family alpha-L-glutamate ligase n=1 Tax=Pontibacter toksunensis TaxID=1332631 RepID=A0ABW6BY55_9BACT